MDFNNNEINIIKISLQENITKHCGGLDILAASELIELLDIYKINSLDTMDFILIKFCIYTCLKNKKEYPELYRNELKIVYNKIDYKIVDFYICCFLCFSLNCWYNPITYSSQLVIGCNPESLVLSR